MNTFKRIFQYARPLRRFLPLYLILAFLGIVFSLSNLALLKPLLDVIFESLSKEEIAYYSQAMEFSFSTKYLVHTFYHYLFYVVSDLGKYGSLMFVCGILIVSVLLSNLFKYLAELILASMRITTIKKIRVEVFHKITDLHVGYFTEKRKGDLMSRITNDVTIVENVVRQTVLVLFRDPVTIIVYFASLFIISYKLTFFTILILPVSGVLISRIARSLKKRSTRSTESLGRLVNIIEETLTGIRIVKAFNAVSYVRGNFENEVKNYSNIDFGIVRRNQLASPISEFLGVIAVTGIILYGGSLVLAAEELGPASFLTYLAIFTQILNPAKSLSSQIANLQKGLSSADRIFELIDTEPTIKNIEGAQDLPEFKKSIKFNKVTFAYNSEPVLKDIELEIPKGKMVALVGPSGGGKSTLADLVPRFYDPQQGHIEIDGIPLKDYKVEEIRKHMGIVTQESILFNDTIFNNIAFGKVNVTEEEVIQAAKVANAYDFICQLDKGLYTNIGERGLKLSGGQRQRISIARAVLQNPPILILDEATSALDSESEKLVQEALFNLMKNRTSIVIAHRLSTIQHADHIIVIKDGRIEEQGGHQELIGQSGLYSKLTKMQSF